MLSDPLLKYALQSIEFLNFVVSVPLKRLSNLISRVIPRLKRKEKSKKLAVNCGHFSGSLDLLSAHIQSF